MLGLVYLVVPRQEDGVAGADAVIQTAEADTAEAGDESEATADREEPAGETEVVAAEAKGPGPRGGVVVGGPQRVSGGQGATAPAAKSTTLRVFLPENASLRIDGRKIPGKGSKRDLIAPALVKGKQHFAVTAVWEPNDYTTFFRTRKVAPSPGKTVVVDLRKEDPRQKDRIEIGFYPSPQDVIERMCKIAELTKDDVVYDLGCGDGRAVITAVAKYGAGRGVGIDLDPKLVAKSKAVAEKRGVSDRVEFRQGDVLDIKDLADATVVMLYMGEDVNQRLRPILQKSLKPGARVVSHAFGMGTWEPTETWNFIDRAGEERNILMWIIPTRKGKAPKVEHAPQR
jgi:uncharacterized protein (TIGR03000 family)